MRITQMLFDRQKSAEAISSVIETITPEMAKQLLGSLSEHQRRLTERHVEMLARQIREGRWELNGQSIVISKSGKVIDGQHRLAAIVMAGVPIRTLVIRGVPDESFKTIDQGRNRTAVQFVRHKYRTDMTGCAIWIWRWLNSDWQRRALKPSNEEILDTLEEFQETIAASVATIQRTTRKMSSERPFQAFLFWYYWTQEGVSVNALEDIFYRIAVGEGLDSKDPELALRNRLLQDSTRAKLDRHILRALWVKTLKAAISGKKVSLMRWARGEAYPMLGLREKPTEAA